MKEKAIKIIYTTLGATFGFVLAILLMFVDREQTTKWFEILFQGLVGSFIVSSFILYLTLKFQERQDQAKLINKSMILMGEIIRHRRFLIRLNNATTRHDIAGQLKLGFYLCSEWNKVKYDLYDFPDFLRGDILAYYVDMEGYCKLIENDSVELILSEKNAIIDTLNQANEIIGHLGTIADK